MADYDQHSFDELKKYTTDMETQDSKKVELCKRMDSLYWMYWKEEKDVEEGIENVKITRSPLARNSVVGAIRLLTATEPVISVPHDINNALAVRQSSKIEKFARAMWFASGRYSGDPLHNDVVRSALLYSEVIIAINSTRDMVQMATIPAVKSRMEDLNNRTPYLFEIWSPKSCNTERDKYGILGFHRKIKTKASYIMDVYGAEGLKALTANKNKKTPERRDQETLHIFYDLRDICIWTDGSSIPIKYEAHGLPFIPIVSQIVEGSDLFDQDTYYQQEPFLYTLDRTNLVDRQSLMLTALYTMIFSIGANAMFVNYLVNPENPPKADFSEPGGEINMRVGERREPMARQVIDPSLLQGWEMSKDLEGQSTIYKQTLGEPLGSNAPYSMVALLSQSGRLPLVSAQRKAGWSIGEAIEIACRWMKKENITSTAKYQTTIQELAPEDVPDDLNVEVKLDISLPTDKLQAANAANMLTQGDNPMVSQQWARENILDIGQSEDMVRQIWAEKASGIFFQKYMYQLIAELAEWKQKAMMPGNMGGVPGAPAGQAPMENPPEMPVPPEEMPPVTPQGTPPAAPPENAPNYGTPPQPTGPVGPVENTPPLPPIEPPFSQQRPR